MIEQVYKDRERFDVVPQKESFQLSIDMLIKFIDALDVVETGNCLARATHLVLSDETCTLLHSWGVDKVTRHDEGTRDKTGGIFDDVLPVGRASEYENHQYYGIRQT